MKFKLVFKVIWISILSTFLLVLSQNLTNEGFEGITKIKMSVIDVPIEYLLINFLIFVALTILFIYVNKFIPTRKLLKGIFYVVVIIVLWIALRFQPFLFENFSKYLHDSVVFAIPMIIYGVLLGYLSTDKKIDFKLDRRQISYLIISAVWLLFHIIYIVIAKPAKGQLANYGIWLIMTSLIIGLVFGFIYETIYLSNYNSFFVTSISIFLIFTTYYGYRFTLSGKLDLELFIRVALDVFSVIIATQFLDFYFNRIVHKEIEEV